MDMRYAAELTIFPELHLTQHTTLSGGQPGLLGPSHLYNIVKSLQLTTVLWTPTQLLSCSHFRCSSGWLLPNESRPPTLSEDMLQGDQPIMKRKMNNNYD